jgi:hypothetical protein
METIPQSLHAIVQGFFRFIQPFHRAIFRWENTSNSHIGSFSADRMTLLNQLNRKCNDWWLSRLIEGHLDWTCKTQVRRREPRAWNGSRNMIYTSRARLAGCCWSRSGCGECVLRQPYLVNSRFLSMWLDVNEHLQTFLFRLVTFSRGHLGLKIAGTFVSGSLSAKLHFEWFSIESVSTDAKLITSQVCEYDQSQTRSRFGELITNRS